MGNKSQTQQKSTYPEEGNAYTSDSYPSVDDLIKIPQGDDPALPLLSVIVTIFSSQSYDNLFREVKQVAANGRISLYSMSLLFIPQFLDHLQKVKLSENKVLLELEREMEEVSPDAILFNFECCEGCSHTFPKCEETMKLIALGLERGNMVMCSDFAVKSLIKGWEKTLGPNPFVELGECSSFLEIYFDPKTLKDSPSKQLQMVGELNESGKTVIHALGGTVVFGLNKNCSFENDTYKLSILTVVTKTVGYEVQKEGINNAKIIENEGPIGHAILRYNSGGILLVSAGHWIELSNLNVNMDNLEKAAVGNYGEKNEYMKEIGEIKVMKDENLRKTKMNSLAKKFVQQTAACNYSSKTSNNISNKK